MVVRLRVFLDSLSGSASQAVRPTGQVKLPLHFEASGLSVLLTATAVHVTTSSVLNGGRLGTEGYSIRALLSAAETGDGERVVGISITTTAEEKGRFRVFRVAFVVGY